MKNQTAKQVNNVSCPVIEASRSARAEALATRLEAGATALAEFAASLSEREWEIRGLKDGRNQHQRLETTIAD